MPTLTTRYMEKADFSNPHSYHPTPQFKREAYLSLNGKWDFAISKSENTPIFHDKITVPFCPESPASGLGITIKPGDVMHYRTYFTLPENMCKDKTLLHFGAIDQHAKVYLNGKLIGENHGGYIPFSFDITDALVKGENVLYVIATDGLDHKYPYGKQKYDRGGMWYTPVSGIWQTVWLESLPKNNISKIDITPTNNGARIKVHGGDTHKKITLTESGEVFESDTDTIEITPRSVIKWTPEEPHLYYFTIESGKDIVESYFAIRTVDIRNIGGVNRICLNGKPYLFNGMLDQGYYPDGIFMPSTIDGYIDDIKLTKALGFNMLRKHIKIEPMIFYYLCDKLGVAVFQDMVNNGKYKFLRDTVLPTISLNRGQKLCDKNFSRDKETRAIYESTMRATTALLYNTPSVVYYTVFNEGWGQFCADEMYDKIKALDSTRIIDTTSGWFRRNKSDVDSRHIYFRKLAPKKRDNKPLVISEFGGYAHSVKGHVFSEKIYGYRTFDSREEFENSICNLYETEVYDLVNSGASAFVYTQVSDVEDEINGFVTYDRQVVKVDTERIKKINDMLKSTSENL